MTPETVDPRAAPGTYEKVEGGYVRTDEPTAGGSAPAPALDIEAAREVAEACRGAGFPPPPQVQAVIDQADAAEAKKAAAAEAKAAGKDGGKIASQPEPTKPDESGKKPKE